MTWKKRIISIVLCLCALLCAASVRADAAEHSHPICGGTTGTTCTHAGDKHTSNVTWTAWDGTQEINNSSNLFNDTSELYLYLSGDVTTSKNIIVPKNKTLYLCLNGYSLANIGQYESYTIQVDGTLVLCDCNSSKQNNGNITHGMRANGTKNTGAGVAVYDGTFIMYGGKISNNASRGVDVNGGTFTMYGGEISGNTYTDNPNYNYGGGAGVRVRDYDTVQGNFAMYGGKISNNTYKGGGDGGGVYASGTGDFIIQGGRITDNQCSYNGTNTSVTTFGGGLYITDRHSTLKIENNTVISNNTCDGDGGGIFIISNETGSITNCTISNNSATGASSKGGGLAFDTATVTITGGSITDNKTAGKGGAMAVGSWGEDSKITLSSGLEFSGNAQGCTADENGKLTGGTANDVYLNSSAYLRLASDFSKTSGAIVVTTSSEPTNKTVKIAEGSAGVAKTTDFTYGNDSNSTIGIIAKTNNGTVELLACKHSYSTQKDETNHWQECSICGDIKGVTEHTYSNTWEKNSTQHWHECECGAKSGEADHAYSNEWKTGDGKHWHECECGQKSEEAEHSYSTAWQRDDTSHFHECSACGDKKDITTCVYDQEYVSSNYRVSNATCTAKAVYRKSCVCDRAGTATFEYGEKNPNNHTGQLGDWQTNTDEHWKVYSCCQAQSDKAAHTWDEGEVTTPATCTADGEKTYTCTACSATKKETIPATGHAWDTEWSKDNDHHWHKCKNCNAINTTSKAPHDWNSGKVTTPATCTTPGVKTFTCGTCSAKKTEEIPASGHDFSVRRYDENNHWLKCSRCDATDKKEAHSGGTASCTAKAKCSVCGQEYGGLKAHDFANGPYQYDGEQHWKKCANCDATDTKEAHSGGEATCTQKAVCEVCGQPHGDLKAHDFANGPYRYDGEQHWKKCANCETTDTKYDHNLVHHDAQAPTPTEKGWYAYDACSDCDYTTKKEIPATCSNHYWKLVPEVSPTCITEGVSAHFECDNCPNKSVTDGVYDIVSDTELILAINPANHTGAPGSEWHSDSANHWQEYTCCHARANEAAHSGGAATCTAQAVCQVCGKAYGPLAAHDWQPATCTAPKTCTVCHVTDGAALGHDWGAWKVTTPATKDAPGVETRTCAHNSAHTETRSIPKLSTAVYTVSEDTKIAQIEAKVDGLDKILESDENKALVNDGKSVGVSLTVKNTASSGVSEKIKEKLAGSNLVGLRLELTVEKTVTANGVVESKQTIPDAGVLLKTTITLPTELQGKSGYVVYRLHDGNVHVLTETANENGEFISVSADKTQITICARLYSEYVIAYQTGGSSDGGYHPVNPTPVKATSANTGDAGVLLYGVTAALSLTGTAWLGAKSRKH